MVTVSAESDWVIVNRGVIMLVLAVRFEKDSTVFESLWDPRGSRVWRRARFHLPVSTKAVMHNLSLPNQANLDLVSCPTLTHRRTLTHAML